MTDSENSPEEQTTSRRTNNIFRRETRSRASQEDSEDDQTLSQVIRNNNFRSQPRRNFGKFKNSHVPASWFFNESNVSSKF